MYKTLVPAYGRDYKSAKAVKEDFTAGKDFLISDSSDPYDGKPCNWVSLSAAGVQKVNIRYHKLTKIVVVEV